MVIHEKVRSLEQVAAEARKLIIQTVHHAKAGHLGGPLSATDMLVALYFEIMKIDPAKPDWEQRDRFVLSKGHSAVALYTVMALRGYFDKEELKTFDEIDSRLQAHPDMTALPGLDMSTGSLGQGISAAVGMALGAKLKGEKFTTYCMLGDGECQEGQVWEAADTASRYQLDSLVVLLDYNKLQQYGWEGSGDRQRAAPIYSPENKWKAFGWHVLTIDGHCFKDIVSACKNAYAPKGKPTIIIANTVKGRGVSFMEDAYLWHARVPDDRELDMAIKELSAEVKL